MDDISFWANFWGQFKDFNDWIKALVVLAPFVTFTICFLSQLRYREKRDLRTEAAKIFEKTEPQTVQYHFKENQFDPTEQLIFDARKRRGNLPPQNDKALQIASLYRKGEKE